MSEKPIIFNGDMVRAILDGRKTQTRRPVKPQPSCLEIAESAILVDLRSPYSHGEKLWVRETFAKPYVNVPPVYRADYMGAGLLKWKPSIHMPRWDSRITLEVTGVRVERVQEITDSDCVAEGFDAGLRPGYGFKYAFGSTWNSIYPGSWERNDWVWVISFTRTAPKADGPKEE